MRTITEQARLRTVPPDGSTAGQVIELSNGYSQPADPVAAVLGRLDRIAAALERCAGSLEGLNAEHGVPQPLTGAELEQHQEQMRQFAAARPPWAG